MALAVDATANGTNSGATITFSHTCTGLQLVLICCVIIDSSSGNVSKITYNGATFTKAVSELSGTNNKRTEIWYLINPSTGANNVIVTLTGSPSNLAYAGSVSFTGASQADNVINRTISKNVTGGANGSLTLNTTCNNAVLVNALTADNVSKAVDANDVLIFNNTAGAFSDGAAAYRLTTGGPNQYATGWTFTSVNYSMCAVAIRPADSNISFLRSLRPRIFAPGNAR